jgi:F-type H+-transporting ATPase subunit epsilon
MYITVLSPEESVFHGAANAVVAPAFDGKVGIMPKHAPFVTLLGDGPLTVRTDDGTKTFRVRGGFLQVVDDTVRVVAEYVEAGESDVET